MLIINIDKSNYIINEMFNKIGVINTGDQNKPNLANILAKQTMLNLESIAESNFTVINKVLPEIRKLFTDAVNVKNAK